jgi:hypothetical protein
MNGRRKRIRTLQLIWERNEKVLMGTLNLPEVSLPEYDRVWLATAIDLFLGNQPYRYDDVLSKLWKEGKVPDTYEPDVIDDLLLWGGHEPTLHGIWHIYPEHRILSDTDDVMGAMKTLLQNDPGIDEVTASQVSQESGIEEQASALALKLIGNLGSFYSSASGSLSSNGYDHVRFGNDKTVYLREFRSYTGLEKAITKKFEEAQEGRRRAAAMMNAHRVQRIEELLDLLERGGFADDEEYSQLRLDILRTEELGLPISGMIRSSTTLKDLLNKARAEDSQDKQALMVGQTGPDTENDIPNKMSGGYVGLELLRFRATVLNHHWTKACFRLASGDESGAITAARTLIESGIKRILRKAGHKVASKEDLTHLYKRLSTHLGLNPKIQEDSKAKSIFGSFSNLVQTLSEARNKLGDAHCEGEEELVDPSPQFARLVVALSGHMMIWLLHRSQPRVPKDEEMNPTVKPEP